jgi:mannose-6-phosphate isomerase-like protein (cupin superfamily)
MKERRVLKYRELPIVDWGSGVTAQLLVSTELGAEGLTSGITSFQPGSALPVHTHNCDEQVSVIEGSAVAEVGDESFPLESFDTTFVPQGIAHRFRNSGDTVMRILWSYPHSHVTRTLTETGRTIDDLTPPH